MTSFLDTPQRRIITSHVTSSSSPMTPTVVVQTDSFDPPYVPLPQETPDLKVKATCVWSTDTSPAFNTFGLNLPDEDPAPSGKAKLVTKGGTNLRVTILDPHAVAGMHRTPSVDYNIFTHGSAYLITPEYDSEGKETLTETLCKVGDVIIQRGTLHAWKATEEGARWIAVLVDAHAVVTPSGETLVDVDL